MKFSKPIIYMLTKLDRALYYSHWGAQIAANCVPGQQNFQYLNHGIYTDAFKPTSFFARERGRKEFGDLGKDDVMLGCVATNTQRKNLGLLIESFALIKSKIKDVKVKLWLHTDVNNREWDIDGLIGDFDLKSPDDVLITSTLAMRSDDWMASMYSNCDIFIMPTDGEGFGYPIIEAMACGTPVVTGSFGAQPQFFDGFHPEWMCQPVNLAMHTTNNLIRPSYRPGDFVDKILECLMYRRSNPTISSECREWSLQWDWKAIWPSWHDWLLEKEPKLAEESTKNHLTAV